MHSRPPAKVGVRLVVAALVGIAVGLGIGLPLHAGFIGPMAGWIAAAVVFLAATWFTIGRMYATRVDPTIRVSHIVLVLASLASLAGVALILLDAGKGDRVLAPSLAVGSVAASWILVHTLFTLQYAGQYYRGRDGGVDFNENKRPAYGEFAYLAFTIGMTYQVSDTDLTTVAIRRTALRHALLSYLLGAVVLASTINLIAGLAK